MTPKYVIILESCDARRTENDLIFDDDVHALVEARRLFVCELVVSDTRPISLLLGRHRSDGEVDWLSTWRASH